MVFDYLFIILIFVIGIITSYQDFKFGLIKNRWILFGFICGFILYFSAFLFSNLQFLQIKKILLNTLISFVISILIWEIGFWPAGDAKLFTLFSFLLPLKFYWKSYLPYFPSFILLVNIFFPAFIFYLIQILIYFLKLFFNLGELKQNFQKWLIMQLLFFETNLKEILLSFKSHLKENQNKKTSFAHWIFIGVIITIILKCSIISFLLKKCAI